MFAPQYTGRWLGQTHPVFTARHTAYVTSSNPTATLRFSGVGAALGTTQRPVAATRISYGRGAGPNRVIPNNGRFSVREIGGSKAYAGNSAHTGKVTRISGRVDLDAFVILAAGKAKRDHGRR